MSFRSFRKPAVVGAAMAAAISALAAGCSMANAGASASPEKTNIVVEDYPTIDSAGLYIAQMDGLFQQQGLNVTIRFSPAAQLAVTSTLNGTADISVADYVTYVNDEVNQNDNLRIIAEASSLQPNDLALLVGPQARVTSLRSLAYHTVAVNTEGDISTLLTLALLTENGVRTSKVSIRQGFPLLNAASALASGQADAAPIPEPFASEGEQAYGLRELADVDQGATTNFPLEGYAVTKEWAGKYPNTRAAFTRALEQGQEIADTDRAAVETAIEKFLGINSQAAAVIALPNYPLSVNASQLQRVPDTMRQFGLLPKQDRNFKISSMIDAPADTAG